MEISITPNEYLDIVLTDEETNEALRTARENKYFAIEKQKYYEKITARINWKIPNAREVYEALLLTRSQSGGQFIVNSDNKNAIHSLCLYFTEDTKFNDRGEGYSLNKGILLIGPPGIGKTHLMDFFKKNHHASYTVPTCKEITEKYAKNWSRDDMSTIEYYSSLRAAEFGHVFDQDFLGTCFGDLGAESEANSYGNKRNVIEEIIFNRYESKLDFKYTHFTSNLNKELIGQKYGERMLDRLHEMCNVIAIGGKSFR